MTVCVRNVGLHSGASRAKGEQATGEGVAEMSSSIVDLNSPTANMYGCEPCPQCGSNYRCVFQNTPDQIDCDDCGFIEKITERKP